MDDIVEEEIGVKLRSFSKRRNCEAVTMPRKYSDRAQGINYFKLSPLLKLLHSHGYTRFEVTKFLGVKTREGKQFDVDPQQSLTLRNMHVIAIMLDMSFEAVLAIHLKDYKTYDKHVQWAKDRVASKHKYYTKKLEQERLDKALKEQEEDVWSEIAAIRAAQAEFNNRNNEDEV